jgi:hypothetical protein
LIFSFINLILIIKILIFIIKFNLYVILLFVRVMGNGTSSLGGNSSGSTSPPPRPPATNATGSTVMTGRENAEQLRLLVTRLKRESRDWEERATTFETQVTDLKHQLSEKDEEVLRLLREVHKLRVSDLLRLK